MSLKKVNEKINLDLKDPLKIKGDFSKLLRLMNLHFLGSVTKNLRHR